MERVRSVACALETHFGAIELQTASRFRPFARRLLSTFRPPRDFIRARNPCVRARRIFEGWYVRFIVGFSNEGMP